MNRIVIWNLRTGGKTGQEGEAQKLQEGLDYIERLKADGEVVLSVENTGDKLKITLQ